MNWKQYMKLSADIPESNIDPDCVQYNAKLGIYHATGQLLEVFRKAGYEDVEVEDSLIVDLCGDILRYLSQIPQSKVYEGELLDCFSDLYTAYEFCGYHAARLMFYDIPARNSVSVILSAIDYITGDLGYEFSDVLKASINKLTKESKC